MSDPIFISKTVEKHFGHITIYKQNIYLSLSQWRNGGPWCIEAGVLFGDPIKTFHKVRVQGYDHGKKM